MSALMLKERAIKINKELKTKILIIAIRQGLIMTIPITFIGAIALVLLYFPDNVYQRFIKNALDGRFYNALSLINVCTLGSISLIVSVTIPHCYSKMLKNKLLAVTMPTAGFLGYMITMGFNYENFSVNYFGGSGMFTSILTSIVVCRVYGEFDKKTKFYNKLNNYAMESTLIGAMSGFFPLATSMTLLCVIRAILVWVFKVQSLQELFSLCATALFHGMGNNLGSAILFEFAVQILWLFGIHGNNVFDDVSSKLFEKSISANQVAIAQGHVPKEIISKTFLDVFVNIGGSGTILCLIFASLIFVKNKKSKSISRIGFIPSLFNISEIITFGFPVVLNGIMFIPFVIVPIISLIIAYIAMYTGFVPVCTQQVEWTMPIFISAYEATGSVRAIFLQIIIIVVGIFVYRPFVLFCEKEDEENLKVQIKQLTESMKEAEKNRIAPEFIQCNDSRSILARMLIENMKEGLDNGEFKIAYQPQVNSNNECIGAEALMRWKHPIGDYIYPVLIIELAKEGEILDKIEDYLIDTVCKDLKKMHEQYDERLKISINVTAESFKYYDVEKKIDEKVELYGIDRSTLYIEITEQQAVTAGDMVEKGLMNLKNKGHKMLIDDFGMGHTSVIYLQNDTFDYVKFDGELINNMINNERNCEIIRSIIELSNKIKFNTIAEYVENKEQRDKLDKMGCNIYQGYFYSMPLFYDEFVEFIEKYPIKKK
ncbi:MAG: EAL domain-containing protein [Lachnospiraceae bacterium]|nr:EAL domain-containing protein [Lachnospiraceae bacterium]